MGIPICIFEDDKFSNFLPLSYVRPVYDLRCGVFTLRQKIQKYFDTNEIILHSRKYLQNVIREENKSIKVNEFDTEEILFLNGRLLPTKEIAEDILQRSGNYILKTGDAVVAAKLSSKHVKEILSKNKDTFTDFSIINCDISEIDAYLFEYPWHLIQKNGEEIINDIKLENPTPVNSDSDGVHFINRDKIFFGKDVNVKPNVVLDASNGPVLIDDDVKILSGSYIEGPVFIGKKSLVKANSQIYHDTTVGPVCKVGGEIENSIIQSYSNKQHEGFLGHAYLGSWVNIGASSNNSDLKNDYSKIKMFINGDEVDTGTNFMGLIMGDHSKCAINTMFNTGTVVGISCNVYGSEFPPRYIPSFSWGGAERLREYHLRKAIEVAKTVKSRRNITMGINDLDLFKTIFDLTQKERKDFKQSSD